VKVGLPKDAAQGLPSFFFFDVHFNPAKLRDGERGEGGEGEREREFSETK